MRIAYTSTFNAQEVKHWSGTPYHMAQAFSQQGHTVEYIGDLQRITPRFFKLNQLYHQYLLQQRLSPRFNVAIAKQYSAQVQKRLPTHCDLILSPLINPIAYLDCKQPIVLWTDAVYSALLGFYPPFASHSAYTIAQGNEITQACLSRCHLAIFSSDWAARGAIELYGIDPHKVKVVPFGANLETYPSFLEVQQQIKQRVTNKIKLLFFSKKLGTQRWRYCPRCRTRPTSSWSPRRINHRRLRTTRFKSYSFLYSIIRFYFKTHACW